jgi:hypothetical protein
MTEQAKQVPLAEQLESVPANARLVIDDHEKCETTSYPIGRMTHEAAAELRRLHEEVEELSSENMMHQNRIHDLDNWVGDLQVKIDRLKAARQSL